MNNTPKVLDHLKQIILDPSDPPFNNFQAFGSSYAGLKVLADTVRELERQYVANDPHAKLVVLHMTSVIPPVLPCAFNWFASTLVNYLRLIGLVDLMNAHKWKSDALSDPANRNVIKKHCSDYVQGAAPEIYIWRNKVAAHFAATDPFKDDNLGTLEQSIMNPVTYHYPHYHVAKMKWNTVGQTSELPEWALTKVYAALAPRFWPEMQLKPIED